MVLAEDPVVGSSGANRTSEASIKWQRRAPRNGDAHARGNGAMKKNRNVTKDTELAVRVALATFRHNGLPSFRSARDVAKEFGLSVPAVIALLQVAFEMGIFATFVSVPQEKSDVVQLEAAVKSYYGLKHVLLVPGQPDIGDDLDQQRRRSVHTEVIRAMAQRLAEHLDSLMAAAAAQQQAAALARQDIRPFVLGVAWGRTMHLIAEHLLSTPREPRPKDLQVVPIVGITSVLNPEPVEANVIAMDIARAYRGVSAQLPCPAFVDHLEAGLVIKTKGVQQMLRKIAACDAVITSMGPIPETPYGAADITLSSDVVMNEQLFKSAHSEGAIGEICYWLFNRDGEPLSSTHTAIGLGFEGLRTIARDPQRQVILVTGGDRRRFEPLKVALTAGLASVLVSDTVTARYLIKDA